MIAREALATVHEWARIFRVVVLTGARQSGKTTLARLAFPEHAYRSLENPDVRALALTDPRAFLAGADTGTGCILDEVQRSPEVLSYLQGVVDLDPRPGRWILTGSAQIHLIEAVTQSLAGRAGMIALPTCSHRELRAAGCAADRLAEAVVRGGYPEPAARNLPVEPWYNAYLGSVLERDLRQVLQVRDLDAFQRFVRLCAGRVGQLINRAALGADAGIDASTVDRWLSALQAAHLVFLLRPHHRNFGKRLIKAPKLYFCDTGLAARLLGIVDAAQAALHPCWGGLVENWAIAEIQRTFANAGRPAPLWFWRDHRGVEIDCLVESAGRLLPIEIKAGTTIASDWWNGLQTWRRWAGDEAGPATLIHGGEAAVDGPHGIRILPWHAAAQAAAT